METLKSFSSKLSLKTKFFSFTIFTFFVILSINLYNYYYSSSQLKKQAISSNTSALALHLDTLDSHMKSTTSFLMNFLMQESNYSSLYLSQNETEIKDTVFSIHTLLREQVSNYPDIDGLFFYSPDTDVLIMHSNIRESYLDRRAIKNYLVDTYKHNSTLGSSPSIKKWTPMVFNGHVFLFEVTSYNNIYIGSWYGMNSVLAPLSTIEESTNGLFFLSEISDPTTLYSDIPSTELPSQIEFKKQYITLSAASKINNYKIWLYIPNTSILSDITMFNLFLSVLLIVIMLSLFIYFIYIWRNLLKPITTLTQGMRSIQKGDFEHKLTVPNTKDDFSEMASTFNLMSEQIHSLKIQVYEEKINKTKTELDYLTLQIKPHFFQNCLNVIYSLSLSNNIPLISQMTTTLMKYFRYLFKKSQSLVPISEELEHIHSYLDIQKLLHGDNFQIDIQVSAELTTALIPVLSIQTFVENIFKHAYEDWEDIFISISANQTYINGLEYIVIKISDTGVGFSDEQLNLFNTTATALSDGISHIGISNVCKRLISLYGTAVHINFSNNDTHGACIKLYIPNQSTPNAKPTI